MWHYNFDYLSHGTNGYKYIDKYKNKSGKWTYIYPSDRAPIRLPKRATNPSNNEPKKNIRKRTYIHSSNRAPIRGKLPLHGANIKQLIKEQNVNKSQNARQKSINASKKITDTEILKNKQEKARKVAAKVEAERSKTTNVIDAQNARQRAIDASKKINDSILLKQRQLKAAKMQEEERKRAGGYRTDDEKRQAEIAKSVSATTKSKQLAAAKQQEKERKMAANTPEMAQYARNKGIKESVRKTWEEKAKKEIKNKAQYDRKQDELKELCDKFQKQWRAEDENKNLIGIKSQKKIDEQREFAIKNWASKIKYAASLLAASDISAMDKDTYNALSDALVTIRAYQDAYKYGGTDSKNNDSVRNQLYYTKDETKDLVREIEDILEEVKIR